MDEEGVFNQSAIRELERRFGGTCFLIKAI